MHSTMVQNSCSEVQPLFYSKMLSFSFSKTLILRVFKYICIYFTMIYTHIYDNDICIVKAPNESISTLSECQRVWVGQNC